MSRPVVYRMLPRPWLAIQQAEQTLRLEAEALGSTDDEDACADCGAAVADREHATVILDACADELHALWLPHEKELTGGDLLFAEMTAAVVFGEASLDDVLPEAGVRICGPLSGLYMRFRDSRSTEEPELLLFDELLAG
jgi:hypothetical protein